MVLDSVRTLDSVHTRDSVHNSQMVSNDVNPNPFFTRREKRSIRSVVPQPAGSPAGLSTPVSVRDPLVTAFEAAGDATGMSPGELRVRELDERLERMIRAPAVFSAEFAAYSETERYLWLSALAERARETGRGQEVLAVLRDAGDRSALKLATALSVELQQADSGRTR